MRECNHYLMLYTYCQECGQMMYVHHDNLDIVYCGCEGFTPSDGDVDIQVKEEGE